MEFIAPSAPRLDLEDLPPSYEEAVKMTMSTQVWNKCQTREIWVRKLERRNWQQKIHEVCGQTVLPDRSTLIGQKLLENAKFQMRHFGIFI